MSYVEMDHADWVERNLAAARTLSKRQQPHKSSPVTLSPYQKTVMNIVGIVGNGIYNAPIDVCKIEWAHGPDGILIKWQHSDFATFDYNQLTMLVFLCHEARIRCSISPCGPRTLKLCFYPRMSTGNMCVRHPNLDEAVKEFRSIFSSRHEINFKEALAAQPQEEVTAG